MDVADRDLPFSKIEHEISLLLRSGFPALYLVSWEEERIESSLRKIARNLAPARHLFTWSTTSGLVHDSPGPARLIHEDRDLAATLDLIRQFPRDQRFSAVSGEDARGIFVFYDLHRFWGEELSNDRVRDVVRRFRDLTRAFESEGHTWIAVSPRMCIPEELQKDLTVLDYPLPDLDDLETALTELQSAGLKADFASSEERKNLLRACLGMTEREARNVLAKAASIANDQSPPAPISIDSLPHVIKEKAQIIRKTGMLEYWDPGAIEDVGGLERLKAWVRRKGDVLRRQEAASKSRLPAPKGVLLIGIPGCGKSLMAKAVAKEFNLPLIRLDVGRVFGPYIGMTEDNIRTAIRIAEGIAPVVLWIDEVEKAFAGTTGGGDSGTSARVFGTFLSWLQDRQKPVFVVCTANDLEALPSEFKRKGRFDEIFFVDLPKSEERREIVLKKLCAQTLPADRFDLDRLVMASEGFSGAEIEQGITDAHETAFVANADVDEQRLLDAFAAVIPTARRSPEDLQERREQGKNYPSASA
jgi:ATP-dependent 26S proteasome regulatory subunit